MKFTVSAMIWHGLSHALILSNELALQTGLIEFVMSNDVRTAAFGDICFRLDWASLLASRQSSLALIYSEDVMSENIEEEIDLCAGWTNPAISELPRDAQHYAKLFPNMLLPIPEHADARLPQWEAHAIESALISYASPVKDRDLLKPVRGSLKEAELIREEFSKLRSKFFVEDSVANPHGVASRVLPVIKPDGSLRITVNCALINKCLQVQAFPLACVSEIQHWVALRPWRIRLDLAQGYHNFEIKPSSRWITRTIGAGLAVQWRKCVQGIASTCSFFQWAMVQALGPDIVFKMCVVYLDDLIIAAHSPQECTKFLHIILEAMDNLGLRLNFKKCSFTPSQDLEFLGCVLRGLSVHPNAPIQDVVSRLIHPNAQPTPKKKLHSLYSMLGVCAYLDHHCRGLKPLLGPLYNCVAAKSWNWTPECETAYAAAISALHNLEPYSLPSGAADAMLELHSDASDEAWSAVLWERRPDAADDRSSTNLRLLSMAGGLFNPRQLKWAIICKEMHALYQGFVRFSHFLRLNRVRCVIDSKVLLHCSHSSNAMIQRWFCFIQQHDFHLVHWSSEENCVADAISRLQHTFLPTRKPSQLSPDSVVVAPISPILISPDTSPVESPPDVSIITRSGVVTTPIAHRRRSRASTATPIATATTSAAAAAASPSRAAVTLAQQPAAPRRPRTARAAPPLPEVTFDSSSSSPGVPPPVPNRRQRAPNPEAHSPHPDQEHVPDNDRIEFLVHNTPTDGSCGPASLLESLRYLFTSDNAFMQAIPVDAQHLRDRVVDYMTSHADVPCPALADQTFRAGIRSDYVLGERELRDSDYIRVAMEANEDPIQRVHSFIGYTRAMRRPRAYIDDFFIGAAAGCFNVQICVIRLLAGLWTPTFYECPGSSFRIILRAPNDHYEWCSPVVDSTCALLRVTVPWNPPPLRRSLPRDDAVPSGPASDPQLDDAQPLEHDRRAAIARAHNAITGHPGRDATLAALRSTGYNCRGMFADVSKFVERCPSCQIARQKPPIQAFHRSIRTSTRLCRRWHIDTAGPFSDCSATGFLYLTLFVDEASGFTLLYGARTKCALEVAVSLLHLSGLFGLPDSFHSDGGCEFDSDIFNQFCTLCSVKHNLSIARAPNSNGIAERQVQLVKRVLRHLCSTLATFNSWGLLIPLAQRAVNFLHRQDLGCCPQQLVFGLSANQDSFVIPTSPCPVAQSLIIDANTYHPAAGLMHSALRFQERILHRVLELRERQLESAQLDDPFTSAESLSVGDMVLIPWRDNSPPSPLHPKMCGPYIITMLDAQANTIVLEHSCTPPPANQLSTTTWTIRAGVFRLSDFHGLSTEDPSAAGMIIDSAVPKPIDCILSCALVDSSPLPVPETPAHVRNHRFLVRWLHKPQSDASFVDYDAVKHTLACDRFCASNPFIIGHTSILHAPASFDVHARPMSERPSHSPVASSELQIPPDSNIRVQSPVRPHRGRPVPISPAPAPTTPATQSRRRRA